MTKRSSHETEHARSGHNVALGAQCPLCTHEYTKNEVRVLEEQGQTQLLHITCADCQHAMLTFVMTSNLGISSIGMLTDLSMQDVVRMKTYEHTVDEDTVLAWHTFLQQRTASFIHLLK